MPSKRPLEEQESQQQIILYIKSQDDNRLGFRIKPWSPIKRLLIAYCERRILPYRGVRFLIDGERFPHGSSPQQLGLKDGDYIEAFMEYGGGGGRSLPCE